LKRASGKTLRMDRAGRSSFFPECESNGAILDRRRVPCAAHHAGALSGVRNNDFCLSMIYSENRIPLFRIML
jgi:hypothetical protein